MDYLIYLDTYVLQKDMRIRMPKSILSNLDAERGVTMFDIFYDSEKKCIILRKTDNNREVASDDKTRDHRWK